MRRLPADSARSILALASALRQLDFIVKDAEAHESSYAEANLAAMTAANRTTWARFRQEHMGEGVTRASLEAIERAVRFSVCR